MENIYLIIVLVLFALAISDLIVGVSNDAVNFLNSAIGSKAAPFKIIMAIAAAGVLFGATFSNGMMEVARKGIMNPEHFVFSEIMIIFLAVMLTDVILLDTFNTLGLPTSTTVSIVFELLGASVGVALIKVNNGSGLPLSEYINSANALMIISGILLSIVVAFSVGALVQYVTRLMFSFNIQKNIKYFGAIWGGIAITAITYFILIKGAKGASFMTSDTKALIKENTLLIIGVSFLFWTIILQLLRMIANLDILKLTVLVGTFALAMAFAGNDLVNFIGVPLAGFESFKAFKASGMDQSMGMISLTQKVSTDTYMLLIAGLVMVLTLWFSKKAKSVVKTSLDLSRQSEGDERFGSSLFARSLVRAMVRTSQKIEKIRPEGMTKWIDSRFNNETAAVAAVKAEEEPAFDMVRASVNLVVASILISFATSLKLPLSTTYVTFMVAMGTSLADRAWGRESAVYRITGVMSVVGGWFFTAFAAFTVAMLVAFAIYYGGNYAIFGLVGFAALLIYRTHALHKSKQAEAKEKDEELSDEELSKEKVVERCTFRVQTTLLAVSKVYEDIIVGLSKEDRKKLKEVNKEVKQLNKKAKDMKDNVHLTIQKLDEDSLDVGQYYVQVLDYLREMAHSLTFISEPSFKHVDNNHKALLEIQTDELRIIRKGIADLFIDINNIIEENSFEEIESVILKQQEMIKDLASYRKKQIKRIKGNEAGTRNSVLYLGILNETKNFLLDTINLLKSHRDFIRSLS